MSLEEKFNQAKGSVKEGVGKLTGDTKTQAEGVQKQKKLQKTLKVQLKELSKALKTL